MKCLPKIPLLIVALLLLGFSEGIAKTKKSEKTRILVTSDEKIDDQCFIVRFLFFANEWDVDGIFTSRSQCYAPNYNRPGDDWISPYLEAYAKNYPSQVKYDPNFPSPGFLQERTLHGNVKKEGEMTEITPRSEPFVKVLLDETDDRPIRIQVWGETNTIDRSLKTIEGIYPEKMDYVANKMRMYLSWEQDITYREYIRPVFFEGGLQHPCNHLISKHIYHIPPPLTIEHEWKSLNSSKFGTTTKGNIHT